MTLKKFRKSITSLTLGTLLITNLGVSGFVKASGDGQKLPEIKEKLESSSAIENTGDNNEDSNSVNEIVEVVEDDDEEDEIVEKTDEVVTRRDIKRTPEMSGTEEVAGDNEKVNKRSKLKSFYQGVAFRYVGADDLAKLEQVSHNSAEGTKQSGFITQYIEGFYNKFTETKEYTEIKNGYTGNYLFEKDPGDQYGFLCDNPDERLALTRLFKNQVRLIPLTRNFVQDE